MHAYSTLNRARRRGSRRGKNGITGNGDGYNGAATLYAPLRRRFEPQFHLPLVVSAGPMLLFRQTPPVGGGHRCVASDFFLSGHGLFEALAGDDG
jgi:hypothetical protein